MRRGGPGTARDWFAYSCRNGPDNRNPSSPYVLSEERASWSGVHTLVLGCRVGAVLNEEACDIEIAVGERFMKRG